MDVLTIHRKRRRLVMGLASVGLTIGVVVWAYASYADSSPSRPFNFSLWALFMILCPPSLVSVPLIDVEPGSVDFAIMWALIGVLNGALYGVIGAVVGKFRWNINEHSSVPR